MGDLRLAAGYTIVELVIVISVAGILSATLGPKFFTQQTFSDRGYADELAAALRGTQKAAVMTGCTAQLTISSAAYVATLQAASGNACNSTDTTWSTPVLGGDGTAIQGTAPSNTTASPTGVYQFDDQGRLLASPGGTLSVGTRSVTLVSGTGLVRVQ